MDHFILRADIGVLHWLDVDQPLSPLRPGDRLHVLEKKHHLLPLLRRKGGPERRDPAPQGVSL